jgi:hypothetical protein
VISQYATEAHAPQGIERIVVDQFTLSRPRGG